MYSLSTNLTGHVIPDSRTGFGKHLHLTVNKVGMVNFNSSSLHQTLHHRYVVILDEPDPTKGLPS